MILAISIHTTLSAKIWRADNSFKGVTFAIATHSGDLNTELNWYSNCQKEVGCQMVCFFNAIWIPNKWRPFCFLMYWSEIWMVLLMHMTDHWIWLFEVRIFKWFGIQNFKKFLIQMFLVFKWLVFRSPLSFEEALLMLT